MDNKANYALVGIFVLLIFMLIVAAVAWLSGRDSRGFDQYTIEFTGPVRGLTQGSEVRLNGLSVGEVSSLKFSPTDPNLVLVTVRVIDGIPIFKNGYAQLEPLGLTGLNYVQINPGKVAMGRLDSETERLPGKMSQFDNFLVGGENIIDGATMAIRRVNVLMNEKAIKDFQNILGNISQLTDNLKDTDIDSEKVEAVLVSFEQAARDFSEAMEAIETTSKQIDQMLANDINPILAETKTSITKLGGTIDSYSDLAMNSTLVTQDIRDAINRLSNSGLADMEETTDALRDLMITLSNIASQLEKSPAQFIAGEEREVMELPQ